MSRVRHDPGTGQADDDRQPGISPAGGRISYGMRRARLTRGLTRTDAARMLKCSVSHLSRLERGLRYADPDIISAAYEVPVAELLLPCPQCRYHPPPGFTCRECGASTPGAAVYACACGAGFPSAHDLDAHFLAAMGIDAAPADVDWTDPDICPPGDTPGIDGKHHYEVTRDR